MKFDVWYMAAPISEIPKFCTVEVFDGEGLTFEQACESVNKLKKVLSEPLISVSDVVKVEPSFLD